MTAPQNLDELMQQLGRHILSQGMQVIGSEQDMAIVLARAPKSAHIDAARKTHVAQSVPLRAVGQVARRARMSMGPDGIDADAAFMSIMSDLGSNLSSVLEAFTQPNLGYFRQVFRSLPHDAEALRNTLEVIVEYCDMEVERV